MANSGNPGFVLVILLYAGLVLTFSGSSYGQDRTVDVIIESHWTSTIVIEFAKVLKDNRRLDVAVHEDRANLNQFISGQSQMLAWTDYPTKLGKSEWLYGFKREEVAPTAVLVGQARLAVIVNSANPVRGLGTLP